MHLTLKFQWNSETVHLGEVKSNNFKAKYIACQCKDLGDTEKEAYQYQDSKAYESILHSIISVLGNLGSKIKPQI